MAGFDCSRVGQDGERVMKSEKPREREREREDVNVISFVKECLAICLFFTDVYSYKRDDDKTRFSVARK